MLQTVKPHALIKVIARNIQRGITMYNVKSQSVVTSLCTGFDDAKCGFHGEEPNIDS